ncbi:hypothetical protein JOY44_00165 [Phormidium sp. CLA17]|uniref:hypothetical protein n=1 Tax=Leptolyngbya sp. Cla-17 TaxID=2803751 RepID=UPI001491FD57|nr:hypothetical protein [Leptolyngbya sp. Cla-17]MBM0740069.1 hypothetical protein [Leptolyngbya sp. Cla-17]
MTDDELRQLIASNARAIEAAASERIEMRTAILKLTDLQEGVINLLSRLDEERPTILRKLNTIENKIDQLLQSE